MKEFNQWLTDLTRELRTKDNLPAPAIDYNSIHDLLISTIKSVAWRAENQRPMEQRIHRKIDRLITQAQIIRNALKNEVTADLRDKTVLTLFDQKVMGWVTELYRVRQLVPVGEIPCWHRKNHYKPWCITSA